MNIKNFTLDEEEFQELEIGGYGNILPPKNDKIALIDADTILYQVCVTAEKELYHDNVDAEKYLDELTDMVDAQLQTLLESTGCKGYEIHLTTGRNFRYDIYPAYKENRKGIPTPKYLHELKEHLKDKRDAYLHRYIEADDFVVFLKDTYPNKYLLCAIDKDVIYAIEGTHYNYLYRDYVTSNGNNIQLRPHFVTVKKVEAVWWKFLQALVGDATDNVKGIPGFGIAKLAYELREIGIKIPKVRKLQEILQYLPLKSYEEVETWYYKVCEYYGLSYEDAKVNLMVVDTRILYVDTKNNLRIAGIDKKLDNYKLSNGKWTIIKE